MCNKAILILLATLGLSFNAYAEEVETQQFYDRELLTETLTADDQEALAAAQEANQIALETDQAAADAAAADATAAAAAQADADAAAAAQADTDAATAQANADADPGNTDLATTASELQALADQTDATALQTLADETDASALQTAADETDAGALQTVADETDAAETAEALGLIETEFAETATFVEGLTDEQVFALNRSLNNALSSGLLVDIDVEDLALIADANKLQINAFTQAFEQEARFLLKADKFAAKYEESGNEKFLGIGERMGTKGETQKAKFLAKIDRFNGSPSASASSAAKAEAKASAKAAAKETSKGVAKATAKKAAKAAAKETAKGVAKNEAKRSAKAAAKLLAKHGK